MTEAPTPAPLRVLIVEDDRRLVALVAEYLELRGVFVRVVHDGPNGLAAALAEPWDAVLLDWMLPGLDGIAVCRRLRERSDVPVLILTALDSEAERVVALEAGADGHVGKPFSTAELLARIRAVVRRHRGELRPPDQRMVVGDLRIDEATREVTVGDHPIDLTPHETDLLIALARRPGHVLSRERLLELTHGDPGDAFDRSVDGHISRIRQKIGDDPLRPRRIRTVRGIGYQLVAATDGKDG